MYLELAGLDVPQDGRAIAARLPNTENTGFEKNETIKCVDSC